MARKSNNVQRNNQNKIKRKGRPPKKKKYVQQIDSSDEDISSVRNASARPRVVPIRKNEIPMRPEIHIPPASIPSFNDNSSNIQQSSSDGKIPPQVNEQHPSPATTSSRITITMTSITTNVADNSNTTTYVTTEILPINGMMVPSQLDNSENQLRASTPNISMAAPVNSSNSLNNLYSSSGSYARTETSEALNPVTQTPAAVPSISDVPGYPQNALNGVDLNNYQASNGSSNTMASNLAITQNSQVNDLRMNLYNMPGLSNSTPPTDNSLTFIHSDNSDNNTKHSSSTAKAQHNDMCGSSDSLGNLTYSFPVNYGPQFSTGNNEITATRPKYS